MPSLWHAFGVANPYVLASVHCPFVNAVQVASGNALPRTGRSSAKQKLSQWKSRSLLTALVIVPLTTAVTDGAGAQTFIGPGTITSTQSVDATNSPATVVGNTTISVPGGDGIDAPGYNGLGGTLTINTEATTPPPASSAPGSITITTGGNGVTSVFPSGSATININSGPSGNVTIMSGGTALGISGNASLTATNANGGSLTLHSTGSFGAVAQFGAVLNLTGATIISDGGVAAVLIGGDLTDQGSIGNLTNVTIRATDLTGLDATRMGTVATMSGHHGNGR
jgi:hypothetical protein